MSNIRSEIESAALVFANSVFQILRKYSIDDLTTAVGAAGDRPRHVPAPHAPAQVSSPARGSRRATVPSDQPARGRRVRNDEDIPALAHRVVDLVARQGEMGRKAIQEGTGSRQETLQKALAFARGHGALSLQGEKRNARYVATGKSLP